MVRIARVKFSGSSRTFDYFCPDTSIDEGDVVYLEGQENPSFVYEIAEVDDKDCKATKKVLSKAEENENVTLSSKYMDITKATQECIVNSLGKEIQQFGNICRSIFEAAQSQEFVDILNNNSLCNIFDIFVTDAGQLPSKHIIHIVMPYKFQDKHNEQLKKAFSLVIDKAISLNYKSIAIPYIGTGANGYTYGDIHQALNDVMFNYQYKKGIEIDITSVRFHTKKEHRYIVENERYTDEILESRGTPKIRSDYSIQDKLCSNYSFKAKKELFDIDVTAGMENISKIQKAIRLNYNTDDELKVESLYSPADFVKAAVKKIGGYSKVPLLKEVLNSDARKNIAKFSKTIRKEEIYCSSYLLKLNFTQIIQFMEISGYTFSPVSKNNLDVEVFKYIVNNNGFTKSQSSIDSYFYDLGEEISNVVIDYEAPKKRKKAEDSAN